MHEKTLPRQAPADLTVDTLVVDVVDGPDAGPAKRVSGDRVAIGSAEGNDLVLRDPTVSRFHLDVVRDPRGFLLVDHGSTNGTRVGPVLVERALGPPGTPRPKNSESRCAGSRPAGRRGRADRERVGRLTGAQAQDRPVKVAMMGSVTASRGYRNGA